MGIPLFPGRNICNTFIDMYVVFPIQKHGEHGDLDPSYRRFIVQASISNIYVWGHEPEADLPKI